MIYLSLHFVICYLFCIGTVLVIGYIVRATATATATAFAN